MSWCVAPVYTFRFQPAFDKQAIWAGLKTSGIVLSSMIVSFCHSSLSHSSFVFAVCFVLTKETYRSEFPGLKASPNWVLSDAAGGTQVHDEPLPRLFQAHQGVVAAVAASLANSTANLGGTYPSAIETIRGKCLQIIIQNPIPRGAPSS